MLLGPRLKLFSAELSRGVDGCALCALCAQATLAENAGLHPLSIVTELRARHTAGDKTFGINVRKGKASNDLRSPSGLPPVSGWIEWIDPCDH